MPTRKCDAGHRPPDRILTGLNSLADSIKIKTVLSSFYGEFSKLSKISVEDQWTKLKDVIFKIINKYIPTKTLKNKIDVPWVTTEIKRLLKKGLSYSKFTKKQKY